MHIWSLLTFITAAHLAAGAAIEKRSGPGACRLPEWTDPNPAGNRNFPRAICESRWPEPDFISKLTAGYNRWGSMTSIVIEYRSGLKAIYGTVLDLNHDKHFSVSLDTDELVTEAYVGSNGDGSRAGDFRLKTNKGKDIRVGDNPDAILHQIDVGTGILVAAQVHYGDEIDAFGLTFLGGKVRDITLTNIRFVEDPLSIPQPIQEKSLYRVHYYNGNAEEGGFKFQGEDQATEEVTHTSATTGMFGGEFTWATEGGVPVLKGNVGASLKWSVEWKNEAATTNKHLRTLKWEQSGKLLPGKGVTCTSRTHEGTANVDYIGKITINLTNGQSYSYDERGHLKASNFADVLTECSPDDVVSVEGIPNGEVFPL